MHRVLKIRFKGNIMKKFSAFMAVGLMALSFTYLTIEQGLLYEKFITNPVEKIIGFTGGKTDKAKIRFEKYIHDDIQFIQTLHYENKPLKIDVPVIVKKPQFLIDELSIKYLGVIKEHITSENEMYQDSQMMAYGFIARYNAKYNNNTKELYNSSIAVGVRALQKHGMFRQTFPETNIRTSFIFYHELGHYLLASLHDTKGIRLMDDRESLLQHIQNNSSEPITNKGKENIELQYSETAADAFAMMMLKLKYPDIDIKERTQLLSGGRSDDAEITHMSSAGLAVLAEDIERLPSNITVEELLTKSKEIATINTEFFSDVSFDKKSVSISPINLDTNTILNNVVLAKKKYHSAVENDEAKFKRIF